MTLTELKYIVALAREKNFNRAAEKCFVSQPTLSIAIKKLEDSLNVTIFERNKNQVTVTSVGKEIIQQAQKTLEEAEKIKFIAQAGQNQLTEKLSIGAIHTVGPYLFPQLIAELRQLAPDLPLVIEENFTANLVEKVTNGLLDAAIVALPFKNPGLSTVSVYREPFEIITPKDHAWRNKKTIAPKDFEDQTVLLLGEGNCFRDQVLRACPACALPAEAKNHAEKMLEGSSLETIRYMVASGMGISVMPRMATQRHGVSDNLIEVKAFANPVPEREIAIAYRESFPRPDAIQLLATAIKACLPSNIKQL